MERQTELGNVNPESAHAAGLGSGNWYGQVAKATLAVGAAAVVGASATDAMGDVVKHTVNAPVAAGANHEGSPNGQQQMLYFDLVSGKTHAGVVGASSVGLSTMDASPQANYRFGLIRVGKNWLGMYGRAANNAVKAVNNEIMGTGAPVPWWPVAPNGTWQQANYVRPFQLAANALVGPAGEFHAAPPRTWMGETFATGVNVQTMMAGGGTGFWNTGGSGYLGLRFSPTNDGVNYHYGWAEISIDANRNMTLVSMAYETELNAPILAGQTVVPEPASAALLLLGAAGLASFRGQKKRKAQPSPEATTELPN